jgi:Tfp pilus assembly protein PilX
MPVVRTTGARARRAHDGALMALTLRTLVLATLLALGGAATRLSSRRYLWELASRSNYTGL